MEGFVRGDVVIVPFPFSDLSQSKRRPALVAANLEGDDIILCQITSGARIDRYSIALCQDDFRQGDLRFTSIIRPNRLFTADKGIILYKAGSLGKSKMEEVEREIVGIFSG